MVKAEQLLNGTMLSDGEVKQVYLFGVEGALKVDRIEYEDRRWSKEVKYIFKIGERYFSVLFDIGLTENQEDGFYSQVPVEVELFETEIPARIVREYRNK